MAYESIFNRPVNFFPYPQQSAENSQQQTNAFQPPQPPPIILDNPAEQLSKVQEAVDQYRQNQNPQLNLSAFTSLPNREQNMTNFIAGISTQPNLTAQQMTDARNLFNLKTYYDNIEKGLAANKDLSADKVAAWRNAQKNIADTAAMIRRTAEANGFNPDAYGLGSGNTLGESAQALHYLQNRDMKNFLDLKSAAEKASDRYNELRAQGVEPYRANYLANREFDGSRRDVMNQLSNALHTYGINPDGSYNSYGHQIMEKMYAENPEMVKDLYTSQFANPKEVYSAQNTTLNNLLTQAGANDRAAAQIAANIYGQQFGAYNDLFKLGLTLDADESKFARDLKLRRDQLEANEKYRKEQIELEAAKAQTNTLLELAKQHSKTAMGQMQETYEALVALGYSEQDAARLVRENFVGKLIGDKGQPSPEAVGIDGTLSSIYELISNGEESTAVEMYDKYLTRKNENTDEFYKKAGNQREMFNAKERAIEEYLNNIGNSADQKAKDEARLNLYAKIRAAQTGENWLEVKQALQYNRRKEKEKMPENNTATGNNSMVRNFLGKNRNGSSGDGNF